MRGVALLAVALGGCASGPAFEAYAPEVYLPAKFQRDQIECVADAKSFNKKFDLGGVLFAGAQGAANNASEAPINPVIPLAGAVGGAGAETLSALDPLGALKAKAYRICLEKKTDRDGSALVLNVE